jgi:hypothetical protein
MVVLRWQLHEPQIMLLDLKKKKAALKRIYLSKIE